MTMPMPNDGLKGLAPVEPQKLAGIMPNAQHQTFHGFMTGAPYELAIVEFDDQGRCYDRAQMDAMAARLDMLAPQDASKGQDVILVIVMRVPERKLLAAMGRTEGVVDVEDLEPAGLHGGAKLVDEGRTQPRRLGLARCIFQAGDG